MKNNLKNQVCPICKSTVSVDASNTPHRTDPEIGVTYFKECSGCKNTLEVTRSLKGNITTTLAEED